MPEILLASSRRPSGARRIVRRVAIGAAALALAGVIGVALFQRATTYGVPRGGDTGGALTTNGTRLALGASSLERVEGAWILRLGGTPWEMGVARGRLLGADAAAATRAMDASLLGEKEPDGTLARYWHRARWRWRLRLLAHGVPAAQRVELAGLVAGLRRAGVASPPSYQGMVRRQTTLDLGARPGSGLPRGGVASALSWARFPEGVPGGVAARAFALPGVPGGGPPTVVLARPEGAIPWAAVGFADQIGVVSGVNAEGVAVFLTPAVADDVRAAGARTPLALVARAVLEKARDLDAAVAEIQDAETLGAGSFLVVDGKARRAVVVEKTPGRAVVRKLPASEPGAALVTGDTLVAGEFGKDAENARAKRLLSRPAREARFAALAGRADAEAPAALAVLRDRQGGGGAALPVGHEGAVLEPGAHHAVILDPVAMILWVSVGDGAAGAFVAIDLRAELLGEPPRVIPPEVARLPAAALDPGVLARVRLARAEAAEAGYLRRSGRARAAAEAATRARALAPELEGGWYEGARAATALRQREVARELWKAYLERAPVDGGRIEEAKEALAGP